MQLFARQLYLRDATSFSAEEVTSAATAACTRLAWVEKQNAALRLRLREEQQLVNQQLTVSTSLAAALEALDPRHQDLRSPAVRASLVRVGGASGGGQLQRTRAKHVTRDRSCNIATTMSKSSTLLPRKPHRAPSALLLGLMAVQ